jgi:hypothetical protein
MPLEREFIHLGCPLEPQKDLGTKMELVERLAADGTVSVLYRAKCKCGVEIVMHLWQESD